MYSPSTGRFSTLDPFYGNLEDPQSFHKYGYVHGDPINGVDPTGMFFSASIGGLFGSIASSINNNKTAAFGLAFLDRAATFADGVQIVSMLAMNAAIPLPLLAGFLMSFVPGAGLAKLGGFTMKALTPFFRAGRLVFNGGVDLTNFLLRGGRGKLDDAADVLSEAFQGLYGYASAGNKTVEFAGELGAIKVADKLGLDPVTDFPHRYHGIDGLYMHGDDLVIVEAKGYSIGTHPSLGRTTRGEQLSQAWIRRQAQKFEKFAKIDPAYQKWANLLNDKMNSGKLKAMVVETEVDDAAKLITDVGYELRNWADIGATTFVIP